MNKQINKGKREYEVIIDTSKFIQCLRLFSLQMGSNHVGHIGFVTLSLHFLSCSKERPGSAYAERSAFKKAYARMLLS